MCWMLTAYRLASTYSGNDWCGFFCRETTDKQPDYFDDVQDFVDFVRAHPKKGAEMSHFTVDRLYNMWEEHREVDQTASDPVGNFIARSAHRLGFRKNENGRFSSQHPFCYFLNLDTGVGFFVPHIRRKAVCACLKSLAK